MTPFQKKAKAALQNCSFLPGSFDKKWVDQLDNWTDRDMTDKGKDMLIKLILRYRVQIPEHQNILNGLLNEHKQRSLLK